MPRFRIKEEVHHMGYRVNGVISSINEVTDINSVWTCYDIMVPTDDNRLIELQLVAEEWLEKGFKFNTKPIE